MDWPLINVLGSIARVYALAIYYAGLLCRLAATPFVALVIWTAGFDLAVLALYPEGPSSVPSSQWLSIFLTFGSEFLAEMLILNFLAIRVFRLLLLEHDDESSLFDGSALALLPGFIRPWAVIVVGNLSILFLAWLILKLFGGWLGAWAIILGLPFVAGAFAYYAWLSFVLPAAAVSVPYHLKDSTMVVRGVLLPVALVYAFSVVPWFIVSFLFSVMTDAGQGPYNWIYWAMLPMTSAVHCGRVVFFVLANAVCFEKRTGRQPGAEKVDV